LKEFAMFVSDSAASVFSRNPDKAEEDRIVRQAIAILEKRIFRDGPKLLSSAAVYDYLRLKLIPEPNEVFSVIYLDGQQRALAYEPLFKGSVSGTAVYPRVVVQRALALNCQALIICHQHPSGMTEPSAEDRALTERLRRALELIDVRVLDHLIIGEGAPYSFSEHGLL
jgi:DNA repair protein RadC